MMLSLTVDDLFAMAIEFEQNGAAFYARASASAAARPLSRLFERLAEMERMHEKKFAALRQAVAGAGPTEVPFEPADEKALYLEAIADARIFPVAPAMPADLARATDLAEGLRYAIDREKDSVVFYSTMKDLVPLNQGRDQIDAIIAEELGHVHLLTAELMRLAQGKA